MRRWVFFALLLIVLTASILLIKQRIVSAKPIHYLARTPNSAYKYNLT
jgi:hypothetical protein